MEVIIKGNDNNIKKFLKFNSLWMKRNGISVVESGSNDDPKLTAKDVIGLIEVCDSLEDLKQFESDSRQHVVAAYKKKLKEF